MRCLPSRQAEATSRIATDRDRNINTKMAALWNLNIKTSYLIRSLLWYCEEEMTFIFKFVLVNARLKQKNIKRKNITLCTVVSYHRRHPITEVNMIGLGSLTRFLLIKWCQNRYKCINQCDVLSHVTQNQTKQCYSVILTFSAFS